MGRFARKYVLILLVLLTALCCAVGASTWILLSEQSVPTPKPFDQIATTIDTSGVTVTITKQDKTTDTKLYYGDTATVTVTGAKVMAGDVDVSDLFTIDYGNPKELTATGTADAVSADATITCALKNNSYANTYQIPTNATYSVDFYPVAYYGATYYNSVDKALSGIQNTNSGTLYVMPSDNATETGRAAQAKTITVSATIPTGVTLSMPWSTTYAVVADQKETIAATKANVADAQIFLLKQAKATQLAKDRVKDSKTGTTYLTNQITLKGVTLTNDGTLNIGGVLSTSMSSINSATGEDYAQITLTKGAKLVNNKDAELNCYGYIMEADSSNLSNGVVNSGLIEVPFSIVEQRGGSFFSCMRNGLEYYKYTDDKGSCAPFNRFFIASIFSKLKNNYGSKVEGFTSLFANDQQNETVINLIGPDTSYLIDTSRNGTSTGTVVETDCSPETLINQIDVFGSFQFNSLALSLSVEIIGNVFLSTANVLFPVSWYFNVTLDRFTTGVASTVDLNQNIKLLPGAKLTIEEGVTVNADYLAVYERFPVSSFHCHAQNYIGLNADGQIVTENPSKYVQYDRAYYKVPAELIVNGTLEVATVGGRILTETAGAKIKITDGTSVNAREIDSGGDTAIFGSVYYTNTTKNLTLPLLTEGGDETVVSETGTYVSGEYADEKYAFGLSAKLIIQAGENSYNVSFSKEHDNVFLNTTYTLTAGDVPKLTKNYLTFDGWYYEDGTKAEKGDLVEITDETTTLTLYPKFTPITYNIEYTHIGLGEDITVPEIPEDFKTTFNFESGDIKFPAMTLEGTSYTFAGWYFDAEGESGLTSVMSATTLCDKLKEIGGDTLTLYGLWTNTIYYVEFNTGSTGSDYGIVIDKIDTSNANYDPTKDLGRVHNKITIYDEGHPDKAYYFGGWYTDEACTQAYNPAVGLGISNNGTKTLYAKWTDKSSITYTNTANESTSTEYYKPGTTISLDTNTWTKDAVFTPNGDTATYTTYVANGWYIQATGENLSSYTFNSTTAEHITLKPDFKVATEEYYYKVTATNNTNSLTITQTSGTMRDASGTEITEISTGTFYISSGGGVEIKATAMVKGFKNVTAKITTSINNTDGNTTKTNTGFISVTVTAKIENVTTSFTIVASES